MAVQKNFRIWSFLKTDQNTRIWKRTLPGLKRKIWARKIKSPKTFPKIKKNLLISKRRVLRGLEIQMMANLMHRCNGIKDRRRSDRNYLLKTPLRRKTLKYHIQRTKRTFTILNQARMRFKMMQKNLQMCLL